MSGFIIIGECLVELTPLEHGGFRLGFSGDVLNTAVMLRRICRSTPVRLVTAVGRDPISTSLIEFVRSEQILTSLIRTDEFRKLGLYIISTDAAGERSFQYWRDVSAARRMFSGWSPPFEEADFVFLSGITLAILDERQRTWLFRQVHQLKRKATRVVFDANFRPILWESSSKARFWCDKFYSVSDIALSGLDDHRELYDQTTVEEVRSHLAKFSIAEIIIKDGRRGVNFFSENESGHMAAIEPHEIVDTTGAGDAFNAGYLAGRSRGKKIRGSVLMGLRAASLTVSVRGGICEKFLIEKHLPAFD